MESPVKENQPEVTPIAHVPHAHHQQKTEEEIRKEKAKNFFKRIIQDRYDLVFIAIVIFAFALRLYYFIQTQNQPLWWDEAVYASIAKQFAFHLFNNPLLDNELRLRPLLLPFTLSLFMRMGFGEPVFRFFLEFLPSLGSVIVVYLIGKEMYDKKVALIASFILAALWIHLFYSMRIMTDVPALFFSLLSIYFFWKAHKNNYDMKNTLLCFAALALGVLFRFPFGAIALSYLIFLLVTKRFSFIKSKALWAGTLIFLVLFSSYLIWNKINLGSFFPAAGAYYGGGAAEARPIAWYIFITLPFGQCVQEQGILECFGFFSHILQPILFVLFVCGLVITLGWVLLGIDLILARKSKDLDASLFTLLIFIVPVLYFTFIHRAAEDRYLFVSFYGVLALIGTVSITLFNLIKKYQKIIAIIVVAGIILYGANLQLKYGNSIIEDKKTSYQEMKDAFLWIKENSPPNATVSSVYGEAYSMYYGERNPSYGPPDNESEFTKELQKQKPSFLVLHAFNQHPAYLYAYPVTHNATFIPVQQYLFPGGQPAVIIYKVV